MEQRDVPNAEGANVVFMMLWHRQEIDVNGSMGHLVDLARKNGIKVVHIDCSTWGNSQIRTEEAETNGADPGFMSELEPTHMP